MFGNLLDSEAFNLFLSWIAIMSLIALGMLPSYFYYIKLIGE